MNEPLVIQTRRLTRYFGSKQVVCELNLDVPRGSVFGFLGRNGSGKTTTIRMLLGLLSPTRGASSLLGCDSRGLTPEIRARVGYLTEEHRMHGWMTVRECGTFQSKFYSRWNDRLFLSVVGHFGLKAEAKAKDLSRGERAGLALALTLAPEPELMILDDPALGLDPVARRALIESMIFITRKNDRTIFFSSHMLADVERVADSIAILDRSVLRASCPVEVFRERVRRYRLRFQGQPPPMKEFPGLLQALRGDCEIRVTCVAGDVEARRALEAMHPEEVQAVELGLEDAFVSYLGDRGEKTFLAEENGGEV